ncbi:MAG: helicase-exonuclease AddAB subunit AddA [Oscillospiraceae bacterium]|nr:helicase-exonuclease AddAB subunit AddA [Oscillospiraceae bacterium]
MAEELTLQQREAVFNRGGKLLVSAAAGSGKTKVLVDRLMRYLTDPSEPADIDSFLIITYTKAAAAELRGKIASKLSERIAQEPENRHLQRQLQRLYLTKISTVHAFCADLLREYAYRLDVSADFRVADESECRELRSLVLEQLLDEAYGCGDMDGDFRDFVDTQGLGRNDSLVPDILQRVYDSARCHLNPDAWLDKCLQDVDVEGVSDATHTLWGRFLIEDLFRYLDKQISAMRYCAARLSEVPELEKPAALFGDTVCQLNSLRESKSWDEIICRKNIDYGRLSFPRKYSNPQLTEAVKAVREDCKATLSKKLEAFADRSKQTLADLGSSAGAVRGMIAMVRAFAKRYDAVKRDHRVLDFSDLEHKALDLLLGKSRSGATAAAGEIGQRFREIMVDEYQDSNVVQDAIFSALSAKRQNLFMVGDVKQSIYQFRLADPGIFLQKYHSYAPAESAEREQGRKVLLSSNFRSSAGVISAVNDVFRCCMSEEVGGLTYGAEEALNEGIPHPSLPDPEVELHCVDVQEDTYNEEAAYVAHRIASMLKDKQLIRTKNGVRPVEPEDIVILLRSPGSVGGRFCAALEKLGIRCTTGGGTDLLQTQEIRAMRAILQVISNPRQDIYLVAALATPVFAFSANDLALLRQKHRRCTLYEALCRSEEEKCKQFLLTLKELRYQSRMLSLTSLLQQIMLQTGIDSIFGAMDGGDNRKANLQAFFKLAVEFENRSGKGIEGFLAHLDAMETDGLTLPGEQTAPGCVTVMSIHKSKGLEFPVVFLCGLSRRFNRENLRAPVLCDKDMGLGLSCVDTENRVRYPTVAKRAIAVKSTAESLSEEMRVLYVAMTRAKDRLIMTYASDRLDKDISDLALRGDISHKELLTGGVSCPGEWVLLSALQRTEAGALFALGHKPEYTRISEYPWVIDICQSPDTDADTAQEQHELSGFPQRDIESIRYALSYSYPYDAATKAPSKQTATQRKGRFKDEEAAEDTPPPKSIVRTWRKPSFSGQQVSGVEYGNAMHAAMQHIRFTACADETGIKEEIMRLLQEGILSEEQAAMVDTSHIARFFRSPLGIRLRSEENVLREFKFSVLDDGSNYSAKLFGEKILLQGVVDCVLLEEDGITVVDFKTDRVTEASLSEKTVMYTPQINAYAEALERIFRLPVKRKCLYFFQLDRFADL